MALRAFCRAVNVSRGKVRCMSAAQNDRNIMNVFDRKTKRMQKNRAALAKDVELYDYLRDEVAYRLVDRLADISRHFSLALDLGCGRGHVAKQIEKEHVGTLVQCDFAEIPLMQSKGVGKVKTIELIADEEFLPFQENTFDLVISSLSLHWVNDLPGTFQQIQKCLKNDGVFLAAMFAGETLYELRCSLQLAELEREGGFAPHISPFTQVRDIGGLLTRAGFSLMTVDSDEITVNYPDMMALMQDLKGMGENNASWSRKSILHRDTIFGASSIYKDMYGIDDGTIPATFQILYLIGWKPDASQAKPQRKGSATYSLKDLDKISEEDIKENKDL